MFNRKTFNKLNNPMRQLQLLSGNIAKQKKEAKDLKLMLKDAFNSSSDWKERHLKRMEIKKEMKDIENSIKKEYASDLNNLEVITNGIKNDMQLRNDHALVELQKTGKIEPIEIDGVMYEAEVSVKFKKAN